jgi:hypothetical protein
VGLAEDGEEAGIAFAEGAEGDELGAELVPEGARRLIEVRRGLAEADHGRGLGGLIDGAVPGIAAEDFQGSGSGFAAAHGNRSSEVGDRKVTQRAEEGSQRTQRSEDQFELQF